MGNESLDRSSQQTVVDLMHRSAQRHATRAALKVRSGLRLEKYSYAQLQDAVRRMAALLQSRGIRKGDRVLLWAPNSPSWVIAYLGTLMAGGVVVPLDVRSTGDFLEKITQQTEPRLVILSRAIDETLGPFDLRRIFIEDIPTLLSIAESRIESVGIAPNDLAEIIYTSGTTGAPKGVMLTHGNLVANVEAALQVMPCRPEYRALSLLPLSHMLEQIVGLLIPLSSGASIAYVPSRQPQIVLEALRREGITSMVVVPQFLQLLIRRFEEEASAQGRQAFWAVAQRLAPYFPVIFRRLLFRSVLSALGGRMVFMCCGGAYLHPEIARKWENLGIAILEGYGCTEATAIVTCNSLRQRATGSVGRPLPGVEVRLAEDGEILIRGPNVTTGYWRNPEATAAALVKGWYRTGDLGGWDERGFLHFRGRAKNMIALADGMKVYPEDIESVLNQQPGVREAVVVGTPVDGRVELHAVILAQADADPAPGIRAANSQLASHQQIQRFSRWPDDDFPRTFTLKVKRQEVLQRLLGGLLAAPEVRQATSPPATQDVRGWVAHFAGVPREQLEPTSTLRFDLGLDSLSVVELLCAIEEGLGVTIHETHLPAQATLADLEALVAAGGPERLEARYPEWPLHPLVAMLREGLQRVLIPPLLALFSPTEVIGMEHLKNVAGPCLLIANHTSHLDSLVVLRSLPSRLRWRIAVAGAADYWFQNRLLGSLVATLFNLFPVSRAGSFRASLERCVELIDRGWSLLVYPEGTRSLSGALQPFKAGAALLAAEMGVPVIPLRLEGTFEVLPKGHSIPRRGRVRLRVGEPIDFAIGSDHAEVNRELERRIRKLG